MAGFIGLPISLALYYPVLRPKRESPFPKRGWIRLVIAAVVSVVFSTILSMPLSVIITFIRTGVFSDLPAWIKTVQADPAAAKELLSNLSDDPLSGTLKNPTAQIIQHEIDHCNGILI